MDLPLALAHKLTNHLEVRIARQAVNLAWGNVARIGRLLMIRTLVTLEACYASTSDAAPSHWHEKVSGTLRTSHLRSEG